MLKLSKKKKYFSQKNKKAHLSDNHGKMSFLVLVYVILTIMTFLIVMVLLLIPHMFTIQIPPSLFLYYLPIKKRKHLILRENIRRQKGFFFLQIT